MSAPSTTPYKDWWQQVVGKAVPWLAGDVNGQAEGNAWPSVIDCFVGLLVSARYVAYPSKAPSDALPNLGGDRLLVQGASEAEQNFRTRIKTAWGNSPLSTAQAAAAGLPPPQSGGASSGWALAGTWLQLLEELYWGGFGGDNSSGSLINYPVIAQQNGLVDHLSGIPTAGADNSALLTEVACSALCAPMTSSVTPPTATQPGRYIPATTPWWAIAESQSTNTNVSDTDFCNRFQILYPTPPASYPWDALALSQLVNIIKTWRPTAICTGVYVCTQGKFMGWPVQNQGSNTMGACTIVRVWGE